MTDTDSNRAIGGPKYVPTPLVEIDYPMALANAIAKTFPPEGRKFHYVYLSGHFATQDQETTLYLAQDLRKLKVVDLFLFPRAFHLLKCR
jgi:hypothetical protein